MDIHKRKFAGLCYTLCGAWNIKNSSGNKWMDWQFTRYQWKYVTCKKCLKRNKNEKA